MVFTVSTDCGVAGGEMLVGLRFELPQVMGFEAPAGAVVTEQLRLMLPLKLPSGVETMSVKLLTVAPAFTVMSLLAASVKSAGRFTVTLTTVEEMKLPDVPVMVTW